MNFDNLSGQALHRLGVLTGVILLAATMAILPEHSASATTRIVPVLGKAGHISNGYGWGRARPRQISNGGDPASTAVHIHWTKWGKQTARGHGLTAIFRPDSGYYGKLGAIRLRATNLGRCYPGGPLAYRTLRARVVNRPGGTFGSWFTWGPDICGND